MPYAFCKTGWEADDLFWELFEYQLSHAVHSEK